jgi:selenoprotein W-related protein
MGGRARGRPLDGSRRRGGMRDLRPARGIRNAEVGAAELNRAFDVAAKLVKGSGGIFDVVVDGKKVFSKHETGRFPEPGEIVEILRKRSS